jgi:hypothetical protein
MCYFTHANKVIEHCEVDRVAARPYFERYAKVITNIVERVRPVKSTTQPNVVQPTTSSPIVTMNENGEVSSMPLKTAPLSRGSVIPGSEETTSTVCHPDDTIQAPNRRSRRLANRLRKGEDRQRQAADGRDSGSRNKGNKKKHAQTEREISLADYFDSATWE